MVDSGSVMRGLLPGLLVVGCLSGSGCSERRLVGEADADEDDPPADAREEGGLDSCEESTEALVGEIVRSEPWSCTAVIRLDFVTGGIGSFALLCGEPMVVSEEHARSRAVEDVILDMPYVDFSTAEMLNYPDPRDAYFFYESPADFGGLAIVSPYSGMTVFGASIVWSGGGAIAYPAEWRSADQIGAGCPPSVAMEPAFYYRIGCDTSGSGIDSPLDVVARTAVPGAMARAGEIDSVIEFCYPRTVGMFDPREAEWIVIINASG